MVAGTGREGGGGGGVNLALSVAQVMALAAAVGAAVGLVRAISRQNTGLPHIRRDARHGSRILFGLLEDVIIGAVASVVIAAASDAATLRGVIVVGSVGSWGGIAALEQVLRRLQIEGLTAAVGCPPSRRSPDGGVL